MLLCNVPDKMPTTTGPGAGLRAGLQQQVTIAPGKTVDKKSFEYIWRSGVAGGIAGCAVSLFLGEDPFAT